MTKYSLTERQKDMLRSISIGLEDGTITGHWIYMVGGGRIETILSLGGKDDDKSIGWKDTSLADFNTLQDLGLIKWENGGSRGTIYLSVQKIIDAVNSNFGEDQTLPVAQKIEAIFGEPSSDKEFKCDVFMIMPFAEEFDSIYREYLKPTVEDLGLIIKRGDDFFSRHEIINEIWAAINASEIIIADCTGRNANVFYELGVAHTLGKIAILITQNMDDVPFDVRGKRFIVYQDNSAGLKQLRDKLKEYISKAAKK